MQRHGNAAQLLQVFKFEGITGKHAGSSILMAYPYPGCKELSDTSVT